MHYLAEVPSEVTPAVMGLAVIILLQLSQFFFAWRKDMRQNDAVRKEDLTALRNEVMEEINEVAEQVDKLKQSVEGKMETARVESARARTEIHNRITDNALKTAALVEGQETVKQSILSLSSKMDAIRLNHASPRKTS